jgi:chromosome condensin MukBEF ATPase and DNA-binding subunit MukB
MGETITVKELPLSEAAAQLGMTPEALRMRWRRKKVKGRRDDQNRIWIEVSEAEQPTGQQPNKTSENGGIVDVLKAQVADLQHRLDAADRAQEQMRQLLLQSQMQVADMTKRLAGPPAYQPVPDEPKAETVEPERPKRGFWPWRK